MSFVDPDEAAPAAKGFVDPDGDDGATHIQVVNGVPTVVRGNYKAVKKPEHGVMDYVKGVGETALTTAVGGIAMIPGLLRYGDTDELKKYLEKVVPQPTTELGQEMNANVGEAFNQVGIPMMGVRLPHASNAPLKRAMPEAFRELPETRGFVDPDAPVKPPIDPAGQHQLFAPDEQGRVANPYGAAEGVWRTDENGIPIRADLSMDAQNAGNPLQRNLFGDQLEPTRNPVGQSANLFDVNGMQEQIPITEAIDSMGWAQRRGAINSELRGSIESSGQLEAAMLEATPVERAAKQMELGKPIEKALEALPTAAERVQAIELANPLKALNGVPKSQRGGLDFNAIGDAIKKMQDMISPVRINTTSRPLLTPNEQMGVPGMAKQMANAIPKDPDLAAVKAAVLKEAGEDGKIALSNFRAGANMVGDQRNSALINASQRYVLNGVKRAELAIKEIVQPVEAAIGRLRNVDVQSLASTFKDEMFNGKQYTPNELARMGLSNKQLEVYGGMRDMFNKALERQNAARVAAGMEPIAPKEAYLASRWGGRFRIPVYDNTGKLVWYIAETSKRSAEKALDWLEKKGNVPVDRTKSKLEVRGAEPSYNKNNRGYLEDSYLNMLSVLDKNDPRVAHVKSIMEDAMADKAYDSLGQSKHFEPKTGVRGFIGDQPWRGTTDQAYALFRSQMSYAKNAFQWSESQQAVSSVKQLLADKEIAEAQPNNSRYVRDYVKNHLGFGEDPLVSALENRLSAAMGYDKAHAASFVNKAKALFLMEKLATNLGYYGSQGLQMLNSIPEHGLLTSRGYKHNMLTTIARSTMDMGAGFVKQGADHLSKGTNIELPMTKLGKDAWKYMEDNGISNRNIMDEAQGLGESPIFEKTVNVINTPIAMSEKIIRTHAFLQFAHHFEQSGKFKSRPELFQAAEEATNRSMVDFRREERAQVFAKTGLVGSAASTLKSYLVNYYNNMARYGQEAMQGKPRALLYALGLQGSIYGVLNLPGMQEVHDTWELFKKQLPDKAFQHIKDTNIKKLLIDVQGDWAYGGISKLTGVNLATRGNIAVDQQFALDGMFPFVTDLAKQAAAIGSAIINPNQTTAAQAAYQVAPNGPIQGHVSQSEPFQAGTKEDGRTVFQKPTKLEEHEHDYDRTPEQIEKKKWGFTDLKEARNKDLTYNESSDERILKGRRDKNVIKAFDALVRQDTEDFERNRDYFMAYHGDPGQFVDSMVNEAFKMKMSREALTAIKTSPNMTDLQKLKAIANLVGGIK